MMLFLMFIVIILMFIFLPDSSKDEVDRRHKEQDLRREDEDYIRKLKERSVGNPYLNLPKNLLTNDYRKISPKQVELTMKQVDSLSGRDFEILLENLFRKKGYDVERTPDSGDFGADVIAQKREKKIAIQAKRYERKVSLGAIQEVRAAMDYYSCNKAIVITNSQFTEAAKKLAERTGVVLWDRKILAFNMGIVDTESETKVYDIQEGNGEIYDLEDYF